MYQWPFMKILHLMSKTFYHIMPLYDLCSISKCEKIKETVIIQLSPNYNLNEVLNYFNLIHPNSMIYYDILIVIQ